MANDSKLLAMLPSLTLEQAEAVEAYIQEIDQEDFHRAAETGNDRRELAEERAATLARVDTLSNEVATLKLHLADQSRALTLANIKLAGIAMLLQGQ